VVIGATKQDVRRKTTAAYSEYKSHPPRYAYNSSNLEDYVRKRLVGTPEDCASQLNDWLDLDVDYVMVGWTMGLAEWRLFADRVMPQFQ
jgi:alkanesulfonate monooxygenase SsuD/methylene tetrahydromethanopterin reductase-like flavin-dependent oxidoreductase (luciferase family)